MMEYDFIQKVHTNDVQIETSIRYGFNYVQKPKGLIFSCYDG